MVTKTKKTPRKTTRRPSRRGKKKEGFSFGRLTLLVLFLALLGGAGYVLYNRESLLFKGIQTAWVESVLIAAGVDLDTQRKVVIKDNVERWKVELDSQESMDKILAALRTGVLSLNGAWDPGESTRRDGRYYHVVKLKKADGKKLSLIFVISPRVRPPIKTKEPQAGPLDVPLPDASPTVDDLEAPAIAIILDDIGNYPVSRLKQVLDLKFPVTFAVLPFLKYSTANAYHLHQNQYEVILHLPMEPNNYPVNNPGKGAILSHLNDREIRGAVNRAIENVPFITGVNNHMGSKITGNRTLMRPVLDEIKKRHMFFVDSRTQSNTVAYGLARSMGLRTAKRDVFLDAENSYDFVMKQLKETRVIAKKDGYAIAIGHPYEGTLQALFEELPRLNDEGFRLVFISSLVKADEGRL